MSIVGEKMSYTVEEFDRAKTQVMNYIMYKKRTEYEVRSKFTKTLEGSLLNDIIDYVKEAGYLSDELYIKKAVAEFEVLNHLSKKEIQYKLYSKGIDKDKIEDYFYENQEELDNYELKSAKAIIIKKQNQMDEQEIENYLRKKGYMEDIIKQAIKGEN